MKTKFFIVQLSVLCVLTIAFPIFSSGKAPTWNQLSQSQQSVFKSKGLESSWNQMPEQKRQSIVRGLRNGSPWTKRKS